MSVKIDVTDHKPGILLERHGKASIAVTLQPYPLSQTSIIFAADKIADAIPLIYAWLFQHEIPAKPDFRKKKGGGDGSGA